MGMDLLEIVVAVEERFGLSMTSQDWQSLGPQATVQDLADWVWNHLPPERRVAEDSFDQAAFTTASPSQSLERAALAWLQAELQQILQTKEPPANAFPSDLALTRLPGRPRMRWLYAQFRTRSIQLPPLFPSWRLSAIAGCLGISVAGGGLARAWSSGNLTVMETLLLTAIPGLMTWTIVQLIFNYCLSDTSTADTVGELASQILARNPLFFSQRTAIRLSREQVNQIVIQILIETLSLAVDRDEVILSARLVADLGME